MTGAPTNTTSFPPKCGHARWDDRPQAEHVAEGLTVEFDTVWTVVPCAHHFHVIDTGVDVHAAE